MRFKFFTHEKDAEINVFRVFKSADDLYVRITGYLATEPMKCIL